MADEIVNMSQSVYIKQTVISLSRSFPEIPIRITAIGPVQITNGKMEVEGKVTTISTPLLEPKRDEKSLAPIETLRAKKLDGERKRWLRGEVLRRKGRAGKSK